NRDALDQEIEKVFQKVPSENVLARLDGAKIANARLRDVRGLLEHPQLKERNRWREVGSPAGKIDALIPPVAMDGYEPVMDPIPKAGENTEQILSELGYDEEEIARIRRF
ncbi:MAG: CoA transferase, partial [Rubrobacteraceae bacterium]